MNILFKKLIGWIIFFFILILITDQIFLPWYVRLGDQSILPGVVGKKYDEAQKILKSNGFESVYAGEAVDAKYPPGTVIRQSPEPQSIVKKGRRIYVTISTSEQPITTPNVIGQSERDAIILCTTAGLSIDTTMNYEYSELYPKGVVCNQSIYEGAKAKRGTSVKLTISLGAIPREIEIPDFTMKNLKVIRQEISKSGLMVGKIRYLPNGKYLPNTVLRQLPEPGKIVLPGDSVHLIISTLDSTSTGTSEY